MQELNEQLERDSSYQLLILDLSLTDSSGLNGMVFLREHYPYMPVLVFSASGSVDVIMHCFEQGVHGFVSKHSPLPIIVNAIRVVVSGGIFIPPTAALRMGFEPIQSTELESASTLGQPNFTPKQQEVLQLLLLDVPNKVIAKRLHMAEGTVKTHLHSVYQLLGVNSRTQAILKSQQLKITGCGME